MEHKMGSPAKIILITSGQPALNPRVVKEADALVSAGYHVEMLYQYWNAWGTEMDRSLLAGKQWTATRIGGAPDQYRLLYWFTRVTHKLGVLITKYIILNVFTAVWASGRCSWLLTRAACARPADLYIAHNLAALPAAVRAAKKNNAKVGFDAEDFHRRESTDNESDRDVKLYALLETTFFPKLDYCTTAAPLISEQYCQLFPSLHPRTILNVFPRVEGVEIDESDPGLTLFWFSQTVGANRGLEEVILAMGILGNPLISLHLLGSNSTETKEYFANLAAKEGVDPGNIHYYAPIPADRLIHFASHFDIGLATETGIPYNREICLTNKFFTYIEAGLALIASDTLAQSALMAQWPGMGKIVQKKNAASLSTAIDDYFRNRQLLMKTKRGNAQLGSTTFNWELEGMQFLNGVREVLQGGGQSK